MKKTHVFIASSVEGLNIAKSVQENLEYKAFTTIWSQAFFELSKSAIDSILDQINDFDFSIFIFSPDDILNIRGVEHSAVRDNVIFELGLFIGHLGKERCFIVQPRDENIHIPTDIIGVTPATYDKHHPNLTAALGIACSQIEQQISKLGFFHSSDRLRNLSGNNNDSLYTLSGEVPISNIEGKLKFSPEEWSVLDVKINPAADYQFLHSSRHAHAMVISEKFKISADKLLNLAIKNFHAAGSVPNVLYNNKIRISGCEALEVGFEVDLDGIELFYHNVYISSPNGVLQVMAWCPTELKSDLESALKDLSSHLHLAT